MKRTLSSQGSPPPFTTSTTKTKKKSKLSTNVVTATSQDQVSSPVAADDGGYDNWQQGATVVRSRSESADPNSSNRRAVSMARGARDQSAAAPGVEDVDPQEGTTATGAMGGQNQEPDNEDDDDADSLFSDDEFGFNQKQMAREKEDLRVLLDNFDEEQMDRYEAYRRSGLTKSSVRKLVNNLAGQNVQPSILTVVRGFAKVFVGEIVEKARQNAKHDGPLTPSDIREAYRLYMLEHPHAGSGVGAGTGKRLFVK
ncbi:transcription initiation factor TFIID subunit 11 [Microbotryomycetes sp. JL221]|nr:transcription initiation factor TFIID subunit 11 [Microbotryomycetes sp. JL221]